MNHKPRIVVSACVIALVMMAGAWAQMMPAKKKTTSFYTQTNLVTSMKSLKAKVHDKNLINPWGLVQGPTPLWVSDNNAGVSTLYNGMGKIFKSACWRKDGAFCREGPAADEQHYHGDAVRNRF